GPRDIVENCQNGLLVDTHDPEAISSAIKEILIDPDRWKKFSQHGIEGVRDHYVWDAHCQKYIEQLGHLLVEGFQPQQTYLDSEGIGKRFTNIHKFFISDIDDTLIGDREAIQQLSERLAPLRERIGFGVATGREARSALQALRDWNAPAPDIIISSVGTEIYYGSGLMPDRGWKSHISYQWQREEIRQTLQELPFLEMQEDLAQREFKLSYYMDAENADDQLAAIHRLLADKRLRYYLIYSRSRYLDILPYRASKGKAIRYLSYKWNIPLGNILVAGDTDNDEEMLRGEMLGVVVGNYSPELEKLRGLHHVYFADAHYAAGILEGFEYYDFLE
ncbi:MAG: HAD-IIB family hydrolase, partial [Calditrichaeota bacterium]|nr:HAD-IIB family hydrolase [Calditrichota bacterium]